MNVKKIPTSHTKSSETVIKSRLASIDVMRGLIIVIMLIDHVRERFYYHLPVTDPMTIADTETSLFFTRTFAHLCAPLFVFLTGLSAWLYANNGTNAPRDPSIFLLKRGLFLILIEMTLVNFSWFGSYQTLYLQVIWAIGLSMISLALLCKLPRVCTIALGLMIVFGHNLLTPINFMPNEFGYTFWTIFHDANFLVSEGPLRVKLSYPVLPWIGVILLGYSIAPLFARNINSEYRQSSLFKIGGGSLLLLAVLRGFNIYGETDNWQVGANGLETLMSMINFSKYPPSLHYILLTLGVGLILLALFERFKNRFSDILQVFGSAPMFFYILHLYVLLIAYKVVLATLGANHGDLFAIPGVAYIWLITAIIATALYYPCKYFSAYKQQSNNRWLKYF